jgi:hypothetical protein
VEKGNKFTTWEALGVAVVVALATLALLYGADYPALNLLATLAAGIAGKLLGVPLDSVVAEMLRARPQRAARIVADATHDMSTQRVQEMTAAIIRSIAPAAQAQVVQQLQILASTPPPPPPAAEPAPDTQPGLRRTNTPPPSSGAPP